jgi:hypothetical protein
VADAATTLATANAAIIRRGSRSGAHMLSRSGSGRPYRPSTGVLAPSKPPGVPAPKPTGALAPSKPTVRPAPVGVPDSTWVLDSTSAVERWSRS